MKLNKFGLLNICMACWAFMSSCDQEKDKYENELSVLDENRQKWLDSEPEKYSYITSQVCFCESPWLFFSIDQAMDKDSSAYFNYDFDLKKYVPLETWDEEKLACDTQRLNINALFDTCQKNLVASPYLATIIYDQVYGYPKEAYFDFDQNVADEEWGFNVNEFKIVD